MTAVFHTTDAFAPEPVQSVTGLPLDIALCEYQYPGCNGAGGCAVLTPSDIFRACSRCADVIHHSNSIGLVMEMVDAPIVHAAR